MAFLTPHGPPRPPLPLSSSAARRHSTSRQPRARSRLRTPPRCALSELPSPFSHTPLHHNDNSTDLDTPAVPIPISDTSNDTEITLEKSTEEYMSAPPKNDPDWMFFDVAKIFVQGGAGGNGCVAFRREKGIPRGGPSGGSGGRGGDVIFVADSGKNTLGRFRGRVHFRAISGKNGINKGKHGEYGSCIEVKVPVGTLVRDTEGRVVADIVDEGSKFVVASGGRGGRGNAAFKTARNNAPKMAECGENGQARWLKLELKLLADVGLVGVPNAGKSTLLAAISNAKPKIADYPFTTVVPNLGMVDQDPELGPGMVVADIPGLLEGAHSGVGLGTAFLRHIERCRVLVNVVNGDSPDPVGDFEAINQELMLFNPQLVDKPQVVLINKADLPHVQQAAPEIQKQILSKINHKRVAVISAATTKGVDQVLQKLRRTMASLPEMEPDFSLTVEASETVRLAEMEERAIAVVRDTEDADGYNVGLWRMTCPILERAAQMTNWDYMEAVDRYQRMLEAMGATEVLRKAGVQDGDFVRVADHEFEYYGNENVYTAMAINDGYVD